ncbi:hypothetical protein LR48_Vigan01g039400 [Vigna angularis]|uniref:Uncharacterized protein n=1 Tax=Phaseolus angularis TaxID=3914 RepID=A0A0L9TL04_PHAAN|nr:hypothetical protein LR48_Vigan01g039400 [Vigna angularis]
MCDGGESGDCVTRQRDGATRQRRRCCDGGNSFLMERQGRSGGWWRLAASLRTLASQFLSRERISSSPTSITDPPLLRTVSCSTASDCSLGKKREKEREHLDGVVEASPVNIAPISARLQPQPLGEVVGGQQDLLYCILAKGAARPYLKPIGELRLHLRQGLLIGVQNLGC